MEKNLQKHQAQVVANKNYIVSTVAAHKIMFFSLLLIPPFLCGWQANKKKWLRKVKGYLTEATILAATNRFKSQLMNLI